MVIMMVVTMIALFKILVIINIMMRILANIKSTVAVVMATMIEALVKIVMMATDMMVMVAVSPVKEKTIGLVSITRMTGQNVSQHAEMATLLEMKCVMTWMLQLTSMLQSKINKAINNFIVA